MLRQLVFLCLLILVFSFMATAQNLSFFDSTGNNMNGQTVTLTGQDLNTTHIIHLKTRNSSGSYMNVKVKRYELNVLANTQNYFCWANCYAPVDAGTQPEWTDPFSVGMVADSLYEKFSAYYTPNGNAGASSFRYILFDVNNPDDSSYVDILFDISVGMEEEGTFGEFNIYPNPVKNTLFLKNKDIAPGNFEIYNIIGEKIKEGDINAEIRKTGIDMSNFNEGIYFLTMKNGNKSATKRFIVSP